MDERLLVEYDERALMNRRQLVRGAAGVALGATALGAIACGSSSSSSQAGGGLGPSGGTASLTLSGGGPKLVLDPATQVNEPDAIVNGLMYEGLISLEDDWTTVPKLATHWDSDSSLKTWTFQLRDGVEFHNGKPVTSKDVVYSLSRILDKKLGSAVYSRLAPELDPSGITAVDKQTVRFNLKQPDAFLPIALGARHCAIIPAGTTNFDKPVGTGPFRFASANQSKLSFAVKRNPGYWQKDLPRLDNVQGILSNAQNSLVQSVTSGSFDFGGFINPRAATSISSSGKLLTHKSALFNDLVMVANTKPWTNPDVRNAVKYAIDREQILALAYKGHGSVTYDVPVRVDDPFFNQSLTSRTRDVEKAKTLLADAGYKNGIDLTLLTADAGSGMVDLAVVAKQSLAEAGIRANIKQGAADTYWDTWPDAMPEPFYVDTWVLRFPFDAMAVIFESNAPWNEPMFHSPKLDQSLQDARRSGNEQDQKDFLDQAQANIAENAGFCCPAWLDELYVAKNSLNGVTFNATDLVSFERASVS